MIRQTVSNPISGYMLLCRTCPFVLGLSFSVEPQRSHGLFFIGTSHSTPRFLRPPAKSLHQGQLALQSVFLILPRRARAGRPARHAPLASVAACAPSLDPEPACRVRARPLDLAQNGRGAGQYGLAGNLGAGNAAVRTLRASVTSDRRHHSGLSQRALTASPLDLVSTECCLRLPVIPPGFLCDLGVPTGVTTSANASPHRVTVPCFHEEYCDSRDSGICRSFPGKLRVALAYRGLFAN